MECKEISIEEKEKFAEEIKECREVINSGKYDRCPCAQLKCEWHGKCFECVLLHRVYQNHIPRCLQPIFRSKIKELASAVEMTVKPEPISSGEFWDYMQENYPKEDEK